MSCIVPVFNFEEEDFVGGYLKLSKAASAGFLTDLNNINRKNKSS